MRKIAVGLHGRPHQVIEPAAGLMSTEGYAVSYGFLIYNSNMFDADLIVGAPPTASVSA